MFKWVLGGNDVFTNDTVADMGMYVIPKLEVIQYSTEILAPYIQSSHDIATQCAISLFFRAYSPNVTDFPDTL